MEFFPPMEPFQGAEPRPLWKVSLLEKYSSSADFHPSQSAPLPSGASEA